MAFKNIYAGRRVLVTGHTGFKGAWLCEWLIRLGAKVAGLALPPGTDPALFEQLRLRQFVQSIDGDVCNLDCLKHVIREIQPEIIFHLAAQSLVRLSYARPVETYATNVMGCVNLLEAVRCSRRPCVVIAVTTDKCYENKEWVNGYREDDPLGGCDPYSSSKAAAELVVSAYRRSFFSGADACVLVSTARAGNVVGGGDWALDRIVPDCIRSLAKGLAISVRNASATRPWQHVLEPLSGYLWLAANLEMERRDKRRSNQKVGPSDLAQAFNFGPTLNSNRSVAELVQEVLKHWPGRWEDKTDGNAPHEAGRLSLAIDNAFHLLKWFPVWGFAETIAKTVDWYRQVNEDSSSAERLTVQHIDQYSNAARKQGVAWAQ